MGKREEQKVSREVRDEQRFRRSQETAFTDAREADLGVAQSEAGDLRGEIEGTYGEFARTGGFDPGRVEEHRSRFRNISDRTGMTGVQESLRGMGDTGGYDPDQLAAIRSGYGGFASTGGFSPEDKETFLRRSEAPIPAIFKLLSQEAGRKSAITGGYSPGGEQAQMARWMAQQAATTSTAAQSELSGLVREGQLAGLGGLSSIESGVAGGRRDVAGLEVSAAGEAGRIELSSAQASADLDQGIAMNRIVSAGGLLNLYNSNPGYVTTLIQSILAAQGQGGQLSVQNSQILAELSKQPGLLDTIMQTMGSTAAAIAPFIP